MTAVYALRSLGERMRWGWRLSRLATAA